MDALALAHIQNRLHAAESEVEQCAVAAQRSLDAHSWSNLTMHAAAAALAAGQVQAFRVALDAERAS